ncbi:MAG TPA: hypothetical protein VKB41_10995 [Steroidobacteraceae bacterium]|nr:hypothetical protein [Steroidobacteraceae bacterium]
MLIELWQFVTVLLVALLTGLAFAHVLQSTAKMRYEAPLYVAVQNTLYASWRPPRVGGLIEPAAILATLVLTILIRNQQLDLLLALVALTALLLAFPVVYFMVVEPVNRQFAAASALSPPANWANLRTTWELGHAIRFGLQLIALGSLLFLLILRD